jgi:methylase of polypeptide subunit release factors
VRLKRQEFGDWQTPLVLARAALERVAGLMDEPPASVLEPSCGEGAFLVAAAERFESAQLAGYELDPRYAAAARARLSEARACVSVADFFQVNWHEEIEALPAPLLVTGNPPWVTSSALGQLGSNNLPRKSNFKGLSGLEALTGKSNFDVSEWMILRLLEALQQRKATLAMLCKSQVARRVIEFTAARAWNTGAGGLFRIDAMQHFGAAVDAVLFVCHTGGRGGREWPVHAALDAVQPTSTLAVVGGSLVASSEALARTAHLAGNCEPEWRSGIKHDCSKIMELVRTEHGLENALGEHVDIEPELIFPLLKSSDVANGVIEPPRAVVVPQRALGADTSDLRARAPKAWFYLSRHRERLAARKSSIYRGQPEFAIFGVGPYSFAPWKVAISGLYKRCSFVLVPPLSGRPVMLDDTCYFLPFDTEDEARAALLSLRSPLARDFLGARIFWDAKRPINKATLQQLDLKALLAELKLGGRAVVGI